MSRRSVRFAEDVQYNDGSSSKRVPTPHPRRTHLESSSSDSSEDESRRVSRRGAGGLKRGTKRTSDSSGRGGRRENARRTGKTGSNLALGAKKDGRSSLKEKQRRSALARSMPRTPDGRFISRLAASRGAASPGAGSRGAASPGAGSRGSASPGAAFRGSGSRGAGSRGARGSSSSEQYFSTPKTLKPLLAQRRQSHVGEDDLNESWDSRPPSPLPQGRYVKELAQTPGNLYEGIVTSVKKGVRDALSQFQLGPGIRLNFDEDGDSGSDAGYTEEEDDGNKNRTPPRRRQSRSRM